MCGLVGLVLAFDPEARTDLAPLSRAEQELRAWKPDAPEAGAQLLACARGLEALSRALVGWGGFRTLREDARGREQAAKVAERLRSAAEAVDARLDDASRIGSSREGEVLAQAALLARDVAWRIERDALQNLAAIGVAGDDPGPKGWFERWRLHLVLNQLARLEVRGRDSGGLATLVHLDAQSWSTLAADAKLQAELSRREKITCLKDGAVMRCPAAKGAQVLAFAHKVAREVGELGANVAELRAKVAGDVLWQAAVRLPGARVQLLAHTRWASNGIISEPNCHPVANDLAGDRGPLARMALAVLNGDVDNYPTLAPEWPIPPECTTDAKIIPLEVTRHLRDGVGPNESGAAFLKAVSGFVGSTAIGALLSDDPERVHLSQRGSGQAIYVGVLEQGGWLFASELYGVVELCTRFYKLNGEGGEVVRLQPKGLERLGYDGVARPLQEKELKAIQIATRDIDRGGYPHYLLKEISEAPRSVERTLRGKFVLEKERARFLLGEDVIPAALRQALAAKRLKRVFVIGQGTAAVAGQTAAELMAQLLRPAGIEVASFPATELSGFYLDRLGQDSLVIAVSQSGTTTDTNRTVDLARQRGATVLAIVNRRGSDLVDKSHGVLYTSDGRDVEMSVASTKAFYCQVVAGYLLGLQLATLSGALPESELAAHLLRLSALPRQMREVLEGARERIRLAASLAVRRRHWSVVGSGPGLHSAREIRIKLSELCYKSVPVDTIEDKKHIDLSSEPLILVCAAGLQGPAAADAVKEVAIFKAHAAAPVVICDRSETRFAEYAEVSIPVPQSSPEVAVLLNTVAGHLFSYETALSIDKGAQLVRRAREVVDAALASLRAGEAGPTEGQATLRRLRPAIAPHARAALQALSEGSWNAGLAPDAVFRLVTALRVAMGQLPAAELAPAVPGSPGPLDTLELLRRELSAGVDGLRRPIDAIKHQAKTVTVGISRETAAFRSTPCVIESALVEAGIPAAAIGDADAAALAGLDAAVAAIEGVVRYALEQLDPLGAPTEESQIRVLEKTGVARGLSSRADRGANLGGSKRLIARSPRVWVGLGQRDDRPLVVCPLYERGILAGLALVHVRFKEALSTRERARALRAAGRYEDVKCLVTELDVPWSDELLERIPVRELLTTSPEPLAGKIQRLRQSSSHSDTAALVSPFLDEERRGRPQ